MAREGIGQAAQSFAQRTQRDARCGSDGHEPYPWRQPYFVGREKELAFVAEALAPDVRNWGVIITGAGGVGKTALAVRAAESAPKHFRRIIFLSAKQRALSPNGVYDLGDFVLRGYLEMLNAIAFEIGRPALKQSPENERAPLLRLELEQTNVLLVLDNLESLTEDDRERLFAFLNHLPHGCSAIVTSRFAVRRLVPAPCRSAVLTKEMR